MLAGQLVVIDGDSETVSGSAVGDGPATLDLRDSLLFFAGVPKNVYTSRSVIPCFARRKISELFCGVLCTTVVHIDTHTCEQFLKLTVGLGLGFAFCAFV